MTHTQGPWRIGDAGHTIFGPKQAGGLPKTIATIARLTDEDRANVALMQSAPEMLQALRGLFEHCAMVHKHWGENSNTRQADEAIKFAAAIVEKFGA